MYLHALRERLVTGSGSEAALNRRTLAGRRARLTYHHRSTTMRGPLRVYLSSTLSDLAEYREAVVSVLVRFGFEPILLEYISATDVSPADVALQTLDRADIVILLLAFRIGYVPPEKGKSIIELEYDRAVASSKPVLTFLADESHPWPPDKIDFNSAAVRRFREKLLTERVTATFTTAGDLAAKVAMAVSQYSRHVESIPIAPPSPSERQPVPTLTDVISELRSMRAEMAALQQTVADSLRRSSDASPGIIPQSAAADFLGPAAALEPLSCFVIMPYSQKWSDAVQRIILEICGQVGLSFQIAKNMEGRFIPHDIWRGITAAGIIVADLSGANPNVTYEIGLADVVGKEIIIICQETTVPFDFLAQRLITYEDSLAGTLRLREELGSRLTSYKGRLSQSANAG